MMKLMMIFIGGQNHKELLKISVLLSKSAAKLCEVFRKIIRGISYNFRYIRIFPSQKPYFVLYFFTGKGLRDLKRVCRNVLLIIYTDFFNIFNVD